MRYQATGNRCAVILESLRLPIMCEEVLSILNRKGFRKIDVDVTMLARQCIRDSRYRRGARPHEAPQVVDCSSFIKWLHAQRGIWLPRRSIQQREHGEAISPSKIVAGDVVFASGWIDYYHDDPLDGVGHVGIATSNKTVIHAANKNDGVIESPLDAFTRERKFRGARRYIPKDVDVLTLEIPPSMDVETSDDLRWIVLQTLA